MRLTLRLRILWTLVPLLVLLLVLGGAGAVLLYRLGGSIDEILRENYASVIAMVGLNESLERIDSSFQFALTGEEMEMKARAQYKENWTSFREHLEKEQHNITLPGEADLVRELEDLTHDYRRQGEQFYALPPSTPQRRQLYFGKEGSESLLHTFEQIKQVSGKIREINQTNMEDASANSRVLATHSLYGFGAGLAVAVLLAALAALHTTRTILRPIRALTDSALGISVGNLDQVVPVLSRDELGRLAEAFNLMARQLRHYRQSNLERLVRAQQTSQATIDSFPDPVLVVDSLGAVEMANPAARRLLGVDPGDAGGPVVARSGDRATTGSPDRVTAAAGVVARSPDRASPVVARSPDRATATAWQPPGPLREPVHEALTSQRDYLPDGFDQAVSLGPEGHERSFLPRILTIRDPYGATLGAAVLLQDVTRFRLLDLFKSDLVATVSHELKAPLTSLRLDLHLLLEETVGPLSPKQTELLLDARDNAERLLAIVNNLLDLARLEQKRGPIDLRPEQPAELLQAAAEAVRPRAEDKGVELAVDVPPDLPAVAADAQRLGHALGNLLENAVTYTDRGGRITLSAAWEADRVTITVADTGQGIAAEYLPHVFERFFRIPGHSRGGGTGLGLAIAREIVTAHGGTIICDSRPGSGTVFRLTLPVWNAVPATIAAPYALAPGSRLNDGSAEEGNRVSG